MGGIDWAGLPVVVELLGIADIDHLVAGLQVIRCHKPGKPDDTPPDNPKEPPDGPGHPID